jgi:hypothetical protein
MERVTELFPLNIYNNFTYIYCLTMFRRIIAYSYIHYIVHILQIIFKQKILI